METRCHSVSPVLSHDHKPRQICLRKTGPSIQLWRQHRPEKDASVCVSVSLIQIDHLSVCYSERGRLDLNYWSIGGHAPPSHTPHPPTLWPGLRWALFGDNALIWQRGQQSVTSSLIRRIWVCFTFTEKPVRCNQFCSHPALISFVWFLVLFVCVWEREGREAEREGCVCPCSSLA